MKCIADSSFPFVLRLPETATNIGGNLIKGFAVDTEEGALDAGADPLSGLRQNETYTSLSKESASSQKGQNSKPETRKCRIGSDAQERFRTENSIRISCLP